MTKDKTILVLLVAIAVAAFCGGFFLIQRIEKDGLFKGQETWQYLNERFRDLLASSNAKRNETSPDWQAVHGRLLHNVGVTCGYTEQWTDALSLLNESLDFNIKNKAVTVSSVIQSIEALGKAYYVSGNYDCARTALDFAARNWVREEGDESNEYARCMLVTARINLTMGNNKAAEFCLGKAKSILKKDDGGADIEDVYLLLAQSAIMRGEYSLAQERIDEARTHLKAAFGSDYETYFDDDVALLKCLQGQVFVNAPKSPRGSGKGSLDDGISLIIEALNEYEQSFGANDVFTQNFRLALARAYKKANEHKKCIAQLSSIENSFEKVKLPNHPLLSSVYKLHLELLSKDDAGSALRDEIRKRLDAVKPVSSDDGLRQADALAVKLNRSSKFLTDRKYIDPWILPLTSQIIAWAFSGMFALAIACAAKAGRKGYSPSLWFILGVLFNFIAYLLVAALPVRDSADAEFGPDFAIVSDARVGVFILSMMPLLCIMGASIFYVPVTVRDIFIAAFLAFSLCLILFPPIWCFSIAKSKGRNGFYWGLIGLITSVFGLVVLLMLPAGEASLVDDEETRNTQSESTMLVAAAIHIALFLSVAINIASSWMLHLEL